MENQKSKMYEKGSMMIPLAIIIAGLLIAGAVFFSNRGTESKITTNARQGQTPPQQSGSLDDMNPITAEDHIRGNPDAPVKIVEYSDFECPFCKRFHPTMQQMMDEYGKDGKVAWVYRHFPLDSLHPIKARKEAVASECAGEFGGNDAFWKFTDRFFELTLSNNRTDTDTALPQIADELGLDAEDFKECLGSGKYDKHIQDDIDNAIATGGRGTPWSIVVGPDQTFPLSGAQPYNVVKQLIDATLGE